MIVDEGEASVLVESEIRYEILHKIIEKRELEAIFCMDISFISVIEERLIYIYIYIVMLFSYTRYL